MSWMADRQRLVDAMVKAEGGDEAFIRAVRISVPDCADLDEARRIAVNTITHAQWDYAMHEHSDFIAFLGARWAPVGAQNDPTNLNANWVKNVSYFYDPPKEPTT